MSRFQPFSTREYRRRRREWLLHHRALFAALTGGALALLAFETVMFTAVGSPGALSWWLLGVTQTVIVGTFLYMTQTAFIAHDREAIRHLRGSWGETNTRSELKRARRRRLVWGWVDSISLQAGDLDHLVLTRRGGLVVIDSKWRSTAADVADMARAAHRARLRAEALAESLVTKERRARHRAKVKPLAVTPLVVLWGPAQEGVPDGARVDGIEFVAGSRLLRWLRQLDGELVTRDASRDVIDRLERYRADAWTATTAARP